VAISLLRGLPWVDQIPRYAIPKVGGGLETESTRQELYSTFEAYYYNVAFELLGLAAFDPALARVATTASVRGIYNPATDIVDAYPRYTLKGRLRPTDVAVAGEDVTVVAEEADRQAALEAAILAMWQWSNMETEKAMIARWAANLGDVLLMVVADPGRRKVWIEVHHPGELTEVDFDSRGNIVYARYTTQREDPRDVSWALRTNASSKSRSYKYEAIYTKAEFLTLKDGKPFSYDGRGARLPNPWGFVPLVLTQHIASGGPWGLNAYHQSLGPINEVNLDASVVGQLIGQYLAPQWAIFGAKNQQKIRRDGGAWIFDEATDAKALVAQLQIDQAYTHITGILDFMKERHPELQVAKIREMNAVSGVAIRALLSDLITILEDAQSNYDSGIIRALQMGMTMGASMNLTLFTDLGTYEEGALAFTFDRPEILPVSELERLQADQQRADLTRQADLAANPTTGTAPAAGEDAAALLAAQLLRQGSGTPSGGTAAGA
jgi:hypothetical protein